MKVVACIINVFHMPDRHTKILSSQDTQIKMVCGNNVVLGFLDKFKYSSTLTMPIGTIKYTKLYLYCNITHSYII